MTPTRSKCLIKLASHVRGTNVIRDCCCEDVGSVESRGWKAVHSWYVDFQPQANSRPRNATLTHYQPPVSQQTLLVTHTSRISFCSHHNLRLQSQILFVICGLSVFVHSTEQQGIAQVNAIRVIVARQGYLQASLYRFQPSLL